MFINFLERAWKYLNESEKAQDIAKNLHAEYEEIAVAAFVRALGKVAWSSESIAGIDGNKKRNVLNSADWLKLQKKKMDKIVELNYVEYDLDEVLAEYN